MVSPVRKLRTILLGNFSNGMDRIKNQKGVTLIELIVLLLVIAVLAATLSGIVIYFVQLFMYSPRQLDAQKIAQELTYSMIEGNEDIRGIRFTREVIDASAMQFSYTYGYPATNQLSVRFRWDNADNHIYQSTSTDEGYNWSDETAIPYYIPLSINIDGKDTPSVIFTYKKANDANWVFGTDALNTIRRLIIGISVKTGAGSFSDFQGSIDITSSVEIKSL